MKTVTVQAGSTARRVRELLACGFTIEQIAEAAGRPPAVVSQLPELRRVSRATAAAVEQADLMLLGPPPPPDDVDEVVVERLMLGGYKGPARRSEKREAIRLLTLLDFSAYEISRRVGVTERAVNRNRAVLASVPLRAAA